MPKIRDYFAEGDDYYFVMEFIEADDLEQRLARIRAETTKPAEKPFFNNKKTTPPGKSSKRLLEEKMRASDDPD